MKELTLDEQRNRLDWRPALLLFLITAAVFSPVLRHQFIASWDDRTAILANPDYNPPHWSNLAHYWTHAPAKGLFYVPVTYTVWGIVAFVARGSALAGWPFDASLFYAINLFAHATSSALVYLILRQLNFRRDAAWLGAGVFALHPIQVEAVANAWSMYTPLSAAFAFFAAWRYLIYSTERNSDDAARRRRARWNYAAASIAFLLALLTKPTVASLPLMLGAIELGLRKRRFREIVLPLGAWLVVAGALVWFNQRIPSAGRVYVPDAWLRPLVPLDAIAFYVSKVFIPLKLTMDYGRSPWMIAGKPTVRLTCLITIFLISAAWLLRRRWPCPATAFAVFVAGLLPVIGIVPFTFQYFSTVADRYVYLAMLGPALAVAALLNRFRGTWTVALAGAALVGMAVLSILQLRHWKDDWSVAAYTLERNPHSAATIGMFKYLLEDASREQASDQAFPPSLVCTLDRSELHATINRLIASRHTDLADELRRRASEPSH